MSVIVICTGADTLAWGIFTLDRHHAWEAGHHAICQEARHDAKGFQRRWHDAIWYQKYKILGHPKEWHYTRLSILLR